jgi:hypothetical protein
MIKSIKVLALCLIVSIPLLSQPKTGTITGYVIDKATSKSIEGADIAAS